MKDHDPCLIFTVTPNIRSGHTITWGCGLTLWVYKSGTFYPHPDEARSLHDYRLVQPC